jgi:hypothetical protein
VADRGLAEWPSETVLLGQTATYRPVWWSRYLGDAVAQLPGSPQDDAGYAEISRGDIIAMPKATPADLRHLLLAAYVWGTGSAAFLVRRRVRAFTKNRLSDEEFGARLQSASELVRTDGPVRAYASMLRGGQNSVRFCGPAFSTKFLYFSSFDPESTNPQPLILDRKVARSLGLGTTPWSSQTYGEYLGLAVEASVGRRQDLFEYGHFKGLLAR